MRKRTDIQPNDYVQLWGVYFRHPGGPVTAAEVWIAPSRDTAERWVEENPGTYLVQQVKPIWEVVED